jgi:hypothetical protein
MAKQIIAVTGEYQKQDGTQGANFAEIGIVNTSQNGREYALLDPCVNLAGILIKQNAMALAKGEQARDMVMCSVKERQQNNGGGQGGYGQQAAPQRPPEQPAYSQAPPRQARQPSPPQHNGSMDGFDEDIPF